MFKLLKAIIFRSQWTGSLTDYVSANTQIPLNFFCWFAGLSARTRNDNQIHYLDIFYCCGPCSSAGGHANTSYRMYCKAFNLIQNYSPYLYHSLIKYTHVQTLYPFDFCIISKITNFWRINLFTSFELLIMAFIFLICSVLQWHTHTNCYR